MKASSSGSEDRENDPKYSWIGKIKVGVNDLASDDFKKAWVTLKEVHDKQLYRLQMKLANMRKAQLTEGRRSGTGSKIKSQTLDSSQTNLCERCLMNETYKEMLQQEFSSLQQKNLVQIAQLTVENNKLKEENKRLSEKLKKKKPYVRLSFSDSEDDDFVPGIQKKRKHVYTVKEPSQSVEVHITPKYPEKSHNDQKKSGCKARVEPSRSDPTAQSSLVITQVPETSFEEASDEDDQVTKESSLPTSKTHPVTSTKENSKKGKLSFSTLLGVKKHSSTQKVGKNTMSWSFESLSSGEAIIVYETPEEKMPSKSRLQSSMARKKDPSSTEVFPVDYTSKYVHKRRSGHSGHKIDSSKKSGNAVLPSKEDPTVNVTESQNVRSSAKKSNSDSDRVNSESGLKRKINK